MDETIDTPSKQTGIDFTSPQEQELIRRVQDQVCSSEDRQDAMNFQARMVTDPNAHIVFDSNRQVEAIILGPIDRPQGILRRDCLAADETDGSK